jgi:hypothetical protein
MVETAGHLTASTTRPYTPDIKKHRERNGAHIKKLNKKINVIHKDMKQLYDSPSEDMTTMMLSRSREVRNLTEAHPGRRGQMRM